MSAVSPISATAFLASQRDAQPTKPAPAQRPPQTEREPVSSTRVTLGHEPSPNYTDRIQRRARVNVEAVLAASGHTFHAAGLRNALPSASAAASQLTYSFSPQVGAGPAQAGESSNASDEQQQAAMRAMVYLSSVMNVRFVEVAMGGQISFGGAILPTSGGGGGGDGVQTDGASPPAAAAPGAPAPAPAPSPAPRPATGGGMGLV